MIISFQNQIAPTTSPISSVYGLSSKGVDIISAGTNVESLVFNDTSLPLSNTYAVLSADSNGGTSQNSVRFRVDRVYNGVQFAVVYLDRTSSTFTAVTATQAPNGQTLTNNGTESGTPNIRRLVNLGYL